MFFQLSVFIHFSFYCSVVCVLCGAGLRRAPAARDDRDGSRASAERRDGAHGAGVPVRPGPPGTHSIWTVLKAGETGCEADKLPKTL